MFDEVFEELENRRGQSLEQLQQWLAIPSVSAQQKHAPDMTRAAEFLAQALRAAGLEAQLRPTGGHPVVLAKNAFKEGRPTVLIYGHYDVQPPEPLEQWITGPFTPTERDGALYARGAADDKGQLWAHVQAISAWQQKGGLPLNLIVLAEGEEEIGSENLEKFIKENRDELKADIAVISDTDQLAKGQPAITYGLRGLVYMEITLRGPGHDLHSGLYGGSVVNPATELCRLIGSLHDAEGRVAIEGFYDQVRPLTDEEHAAWGKLPNDEKAFVAQTGTEPGGGEQGYTVIERQWARPCCDVNGLSGGYQGQGAKTIIPAQASAKVSMRLVADQDPAKIQQAFEKHMKRLCPGELTMELTAHGASPAVLTPTDSEPMNAARSAVKMGFGVAPVLIRGGGSIPVVGLLARLLGIDTLLVGFGLPDDRVHSPNEKIDLEAQRCGARTCAALYGLLAK